MPDLKTYSLSKICGLFDEAIRTIPGYASYDPTYEPRALIDYEKTKDNFALYINPCMRHKKNERKKSEKIEALIKEKTGKNPRKDTVACSIILTMPEDYEGDVRLFFEAGVKALCITCGIKEEDILYACVHMDESQPHLHFAFLPMSYVRDYDAKLAEYNIQRDEAKANGTKVPARPTILKGEVNRKIGEDEKPISTNCGRFGKGFLHTLNKVLEERMEEQGVECKIANGAGSKFDPQKLNHAQREESLKLHKENEKLKKQNIQLEEAATQAIFEKENAQAEASACKEQVAKATEELQAKTELLEAKEDELQEKEIELQEKEQQVQALKGIIQNLKAELKELVKEVALFVPNVIKAFIQGWKEAKNVAQMEKINEAARAKALAGAEEMAKPLKDLAKQAEDLLEEEVVNGVKMATFEKTDQKLGFAKKQIQKMAEARGQAEAFQNGTLLLELALQDWFDREKHEKEIEKLSELDASLYMKNPTRAARAVENALEMESEMEWEMEKD